MEPGNPPVTEPIYKATLNGLIDSEEYQAATPGDRLTALTALYDDVGVQYLQTQLGSVTPEEIDHNRTVFLDKYAPWRSRLDAQGNPIPAAPIPATPPEPGVDPRALATPPAGEGVLGQLFETLEGVAQTPEMQRQWAETQRMRTMQERRNERTAQGFQNAYDRLDPVSAWISRQTLPGYAASANRPDLVEDPVERARLQQELIVEHYSDGRRTQNRTNRVLAERVDPSTLEGQAMLAENWAAIQPDPNAQPAPQQPPMTARERAIERWQEPVDVTATVGQNGALRSVLGAQSATMAAGAGQPITTVTVPGIDLVDMMAAEWGITNPLAQKVQLAPVLETRLDPASQAAYGDAAEALMRQRGPTTMNAEDFLKEVFKRAAQEPALLQMMVRGGYDVARMGPNNMLAGPNEYAIGLIDPMDMRERDPDLFKAIGGWYMRNVAGTEVNVGAAVRPTREGRQVPAIPGAEGGPMVTVGAQFAGAPAIEQSVEQMNVDRQREREALINVAAVPLRFAATGDVPGEKVGLGGGFVSGAADYAGGAMRGIGALYQGAYNLYDVGKGLFLRGLTGDHRYTQGTGERSPEDLASSAVPWEQMLGQAYGAGGLVQDLTRAAYAPTPEDGVLRMVGEGAGQLAGIYLTSAVGGPALGAIGSASFGGSAAYDRARAAGVDNWTASLAALGGGSHFAGGDGPSRAPR